jgi:hypothetical protein
MGTALQGSWIGRREQRVGTVEENEHRDLCVLAARHAHRVDAAQEELEQVGEDFRVMLVRALRVREAKCGEEQVLDDRDELMRIAARAKEGKGLMSRDRLDETIEAMADEALAHLFAQVAPDLTAELLAHLARDTAHDLVHRLDLVEADVERAIGPDVVECIELQILADALHDTTIGHRELGERGLPAVEAMADGEEAVHRKYLSRMARSIYIKIYISSTIPEIKNEALKPRFSSLLDCYFQHSYLRVWTIVSVARRHRDFIGDILAFSDVAEDGIVWRETDAVDHDEELRAVGVAASVGHGDDTLTVRRFHRIVLELVAWTAHAGTGRIAALDHEAWDDAVENRAVVETFLYEVHEVGSGVRALIRIDLDNDVAKRGFDADFLINFLSVHDARECESFRHRCWCYRSSWCRRCWSWSWCWSWRVV